MPTILDTIGAQMCTISYGKESSFAGKLANVTIQVTPMAAGVGPIRLVWATTGDIFSPFTDTTSGDTGAPGIIALPRTDQDGFRHGTSAFKNWYYKAAVTATLADGQQLSRTYQFQATSPTLDLDLLDEDSIVTALPVSAPVATVTSVNGQTGDVTVAGGGASDSSVASLVQSSSSATATALSATYATLTQLAGLPRTLVEGASSTVTSTAVQAGTATYSTGKTGQALSGATVQVNLSSGATAALRAAGAVTFEFWGKYALSGVGSYAYFGNLGGNGPGVAVDSGRHALLDQNGGTSGTIDVCTDAAFHHIAMQATFNTDGVTGWTGWQVWVDGVLDISLPSFLRSGDVDWTQVAYIGAHKDGANGIPATVDEFRLSKGIRYTAPFTPSVAPALDTNTLALLHFENNLTPDGGGYPPRPQGLAAGLVTYIGTDQPTDWLNRDRWIQA